MKRDLFCPILILLLLAASAVAQAPQVPQPASLPVGKVTIAAVKGPVTFKDPGGADIPADRGQSLPPGSVIETAKGSAVLNLPDGSQVQVKPNSRVVVQDPLQEKHFSLEMFLGKLLAKIQKKTGATPSFRMGTPTAVITVRGTEFSVEVNKKGRTEVYVYDGVVEIIGSGVAAPPVLLHPGFYTDIDRGRAPDVPRRFAPESDQRDRGDDTMRSRGYGDDSRNSGDDRSRGDRTDSSSQRQSSDSSERDH